MGEIIIGISGLVNFGLGLFVLKNNPKNLVNQAFALFTTLTGLWMMASVMLSLYPSFLSGTLTISIGMCLAVSFYLFLMVYPKTDKKPSLMFYLPLLIVIVATISGILLKQLLLSVKVINGVATPEFGPVLIGIQIFVFILLPFGIYRIFREYKKAELTDKLKMKYLLVALSGYIGTLAIFNGILPMMGIFSFVDVGIMSSVLWTLIIFYAISRDRLFGIRYLYGKILYYAYLVAFPLALIYAVIFFEIKFWGDPFVEYAIFLNFILALLFIFLLPKLNSIISNSISDSVINIIYNPEQVRTALNAKISKELDLDKITKFFQTTLDEIFAPQTNSIFIIDPRHASGIFELSDSPKIKIEGYHRLLLKSAQVNPGGPLILDSFKLASISDTKLVAFISLLISARIGILYPFPISKKATGFLLLGVKSSNTAYTSEDLDLLKSLTESLAVSLERSLLYEEVESFNSQLKLEIEAATKELKQKYLELDETYQNERDLLDILGHELRTPLSIARNAVMLIDSMMKAKNFNKEKIAQYAAIGTEHLQREVKLLETILSGTKLDNHKLTLVLEKVDAIDVVNDSLAGLEIKAKNKGLQLTFTPPKEVWIYSDRTRIQEVIDNLIDNAIKYTNVGQVKIEIKPGKKFTTFIISDTGLGIAKEDLAKLGQKFFRANTYLNKGNSKDLFIVRPGGTGLGLYVTFGLIKALGGDIKVTSALGKGSTFTVSLPTYEGQAPENIQAGIKPTK